MDTALPRAGLVFEGLLNWRDGTWSLPRRLSDHLFIQSPMAKSTFGRHWISSS